MTICGHYLIQYIDAERHIHFEVTEKLFAVGGPAKVCCMKIFERLQWPEYLANLVTCVTPRAPPWRGAAILYVVQKAS